MACQAAAVHLGDVVSAAARVSGDVETPLAAVARFPAPLVPAPRTRDLVVVATRCVIGEVTGLGSPRGVAIAPDGRTASVTLGGGHAAAVVDPVERKAVRRVTVGASPDGVAVAPRPARRPARRTTPMPALATGPAAAPTPAMTHPDDTPAPDATCATGPARRDFLQQLLTSGAAVAGVSLLGGCASAAAPAAAARTASTPGSAWDMSWTGRLGRYRTAYDSPEMQNGAALAFAAAAAQGYKLALGAAAGEVTPVLILRHTASMMVLDDTIWKRLALGESQKLKDPTSGEPALRNPFINYAKGDRHTMIGAQAGLDVLMREGAVVLTCNNALTGIGRMLRAKETQLTQAQAVAEVREAVLPGVYVMPNGIFAVSAAQDAGCHYMRVLV